VQSHDQAAGQMPTVQLERFRRQDISNDHLEPALVKTASVATGILHAQALLRQALRDDPMARPLPRPRAGARRPRRGHEPYAAWSGGLRQARMRQGVCHSGQRGPELQVHAGCGAR
jgi:hypothetical protein